MPEPAAEPALSGLRLNLRIVSVVIFNFASYLTIGLPLAVEMDGTAVAAHVITTTMVRTTVI